MNRPVFKIRVQGSNLTLNQGLFQFQNITGGYTDLVLTTVPAFMNWDTITYNNGITMNSGVFTLLANKKYKLTACLVAGVSIQNQFFLYRWKTSPGGVVISNIGNAQNQYSSYFSGNPLCVGFIDTGGSNVNVILEIYNWGNGNASYSVKGESWCMIEQIS